MTAQRLEQARPGAFDVPRYADARAAPAAIEARDVYGAVVLGSGPPIVLTASAASPAIAQALGQLATTLGPQTPTAATGEQVVDVVPTPPSDPRGAGLAAGALPLVLGGILTAGLSTTMVIDGDGTHRYALRWNVNRPQNALNSADEGVRGRAHQSSSVC